jgi:hypothetical protein
MSFFSAVVIGWLAINGLVFTALMTRRPRPGLRRSLFAWLIRSETGQRMRSDATVVTSSLKHLGR